MDASILVVPSGVGMTSIRELPPLPLAGAVGCPFDPPPEYARLRADAPVTRIVCPTGVPAWLVSRYADVRAVLGDPEVFRNRPGTAVHLLAGFGGDTPVGEGEFARMDGAEHLRFRRHLAPEISSMKRIEQLRPLVQRIVGEKLDDLATTSPPVDLYAGFARPVTTAVIAEMLGVPFGDRALFQQAAEALFSGASDRDEVASALEPLFRYL